MRILKFFDGPYPWDVRVEKVTDTLLGAGHEVALVCRNRGALPRKERLSNGLEIFRTADLRSPLDFPAFFNPVWLVAAFGAARRFRPHLVLARDLPLTPLALLVARWLGVPLAADLAEPYPDSLRAHFQFQQPSLSDWVVRNPRLADLIERAVLPRLDHAIVVCPEAGFRLVGHGLPADRWTEVRNTVDPARFRPTGAASSVLAGLEGRFRILFSGLLSGDRGIEIALEALAGLRKRRPSTFALIITGEGPMRHALERRASALGLGADVRFTGWIDYLELPDLIAGCHVGILPFHRCPHIDASLANKLFEYMTLGLPVIVSDILPMRRIVDDAACGLVVACDDAVALGDAIERLADAPEEHQRLAGMGPRATRSLYHWQHDASRLRSVIEALGSSEPHPGVIGAAPLLAGTRPSPLEDACS
jgi:glycosyltransferase involved in cell wall biosynthesis